MLISKKWLVLILSFFVANSVYADMKQDQSAVKKAYDGWCAAIGSARGNASGVVKFYAPGAILLPTLSSKKLINTNGGLDAYFQKLTSIPDIKCVEDKNTIRIHDHTATNSGFYTFAFTEQGKQKELTARFTFIYKKVGDQWMIETHHSSKTPE